MKACYKRILQANKLSYIKDRGKLDSNELSL